ncbi:MAG: hypothetical protein HY231_18305 [Acidobacteria bacterium]|nr:hypothetical protein [Acidobacteriota bacterium]
MSEDQTQIIGNDEPPSDLEAQKAATTNPMLEAILARVNRLAEKIDEGFATVNQRLDRIETRLDALEHDTRETRRNQRVIQRQQLDLEDRIEDIERQAS